MAGVAPPLSGAKPHVENDRSDCRSMTDIMAAPRLKGQFLKERFSRFSFRYSCLCMILDILVQHGLVRVFKVCGLHSQFNSKFTMHQ